MINFNLDLFKKLSQEIFLCDSPTGYTNNVIQIVKKYIDEFGYNMEKHPLYMKYCYF